MMIASCSKQNVKKRTSVLGFNDGNEEMCFSTSEQKQFGNLNCELTKIERMGILPSLVPTTVQFLRPDTQGQVLAD